MKKRLAYLMACSLLFSQFPVATFAETKIANEIQADLEVTLNLEYPIVDLDELDMKIALLKDGKVVNTFPIKKVASTVDGKVGEQNYTMQMTPLDSSLHMVFDDLPLGTYEVRLMGKGYKTYTSEPIELRKTEKHLVLSTGNETFTVGDVNQDGNISALDVTGLEKMLGSNDLNYDLNGDKKIDVEDLAQIYWSQKAKGEANLYNTKIILGNVLNEKTIQEELEKINDPNTVVQGEVRSLFDGNEETTVQIKNPVPITELSPVRIPVSFTDAVKVSEIAITAPADNAPTAGYVVYTDENGKEVRQPFTSISSYQTARSRRTNNVITINLGKQVPLQKLTIEVTETSKEKGLLASISKIEFLEDVVDNAVNQEQGIIKGLSGKPLDEGATLSWNQTANVTGYKVKYGTEPGVYKETSYTKNNEITIEGLKNFTPYYFVVQATNGDWEGRVSNEITVTPEPQKKPATPTEVNLGTFSKAIKVNFRVSKDAIGANVYYKKASELDYKVIENVKSGVMLKDLENDAEYMIYVTAVNSAGESAPSQVVKGTPKEETLVLPEVPTYKQIDKSHITDIKLLDPNNVAHKFYPEGFNIQNMLDEDFNTHWTAETYQRARGFTVTFDQSYEMDYIAFVPRLDSDLDRYDGTRKYWHYPDLYTIKVWETIDSEPKEIVTRGKIPNIGQNGLKILPFEKTDVAKMEVSLFEWNGAGNMSISEVMFYEYYDLIERINNVFANGTYTELKEGVTLSYVEDLEAELDALEGTVLWVDKTVLKEELQTAKALLSGTGHIPGNMVSVNQTRNKGTAQNKNFAMPGLSDLQPAGVMAYAGDKILVYVDAPEGGTLPELVCSQFYGDGSWSKGISLQQGRNVIEVPQIVNYNITKGGPLYLSYNGKEQAKTTVRIVHAKDMPTLEILDMEADESLIKAQIEDYVIKLKAHVANLDEADKKKNPANVTEVGTDKVLLSLPAEEVLRGITNGTSTLEEQVSRLYESLMTWDANMKLHYKVLGLTKEDPEAIHRYPTTRVNVRYMPMSSSVFMYASGDHVGIWYDSGAGLVSGTRTSENGYFGWGINHEIGHIINDGKFVVGETTNNIFSLFAQTVNGGPSRLESSEVYPKIYEKVVSKDTGLSSDVFVNLGMFWQLHLAYDLEEELSLDSFYPTLHRLSREKNLTGLDAQNYFVRLASDTAGKDLTPFFKRWGLHISSETYDYASKYPREERALYYLNDEARRYQMEGKPGMGEETTLRVNAEVMQGKNTLDTEVVLNMTTDMDKEALLGYEIYRDGELIAFTQDDVYRDKISANNVTHTYSVRAYDKLLNATDKVTTPEVYIAAEGLLDRSEFSVSYTTDQMIQITLPRTPEVVGLKLTDVSVTTDSAYEIEISSNGEDFEVAKRSKLKSGTQFIYFNKPGREEDDDDRIWTYDAVTIRLKGEAIKDLTRGQIDVLGYPGDGVYFTDGAIGYLGSDYAFNGGIIEKGSLVVMGSYRGHPVYSKIVLSANYVSDKDYDEIERPGYDKENQVEAIEGELYMFAELPEDEQISKIGNGIWMFVPKEQSLPAQIKANMFRTDEATSTEGGRLVSDTKWLLVPDAESLPTIELQ